MTWAQHAAAFAKGAERAKKAGDEVAFAELLNAALECLQMAKLLECRERR